MQYQQIKQKRSDDTNKLFTDLQVFWAFSIEDALQSPLLQAKNIIIDIR